MSREGGSINLLIVEKDFSRSFQKEDWSVLWKFGEIRGWKKWDRPPFDERHEKEVVRGRKGREAEVS